MKVNILLLKIFAVTCFLFLFFIPLNATGNQWERVKNSNGIEIYLRPVEGSVIKEFRGVTTVQGSLSSILAVLDDTTSYTLWMYRCSSAELLFKKNVYERITYTVTSSPWPVVDRDIAVKSVFSQDKKTFAVTVSLSGLPSYTPVRQGRVRMNRVSGYWLLEPLGNGNVRVTYRLHSEPGGSVPDSLVNSSLVDIPFNTLYNLRGRVMLPQYKEVKYKEIVEK